eukprot:1787324-Pleurochrysis_carterae.AAC.2
MHAFCSASTATFSAGRRALSRAEKGADDREPRFARMQAARKESHDAEMNIWAANQRCGRTCDRFQDEGEDYCGRECRVSLRARSTGGKLQPQNLRLKAHGSRLKAQGAGAGGASLAACAGKRSREVGEEVAPRRGFSVKLGDGHVVLEPPADK